MALVINYDGLGAAPGTIVDYVEFTAPVTVSGVTEGAADTVVSGAGFTADGSTSYWVEFFAPAMQPAPFDGAKLTVCLFEAASVIAGKWGDRVTAGTSAVLVEARLKIRVTPAAGTRTYIVKAFHATGISGTVQAGAGGTGAYSPGYILVTKAAS